MFDRNDRLKRKVSLIVIYMLLDVKSHKSRFSRKFLNNQHNDIAFQKVLHFTTTEKTICFDYMQ